VRLQVSDLERSLSFYQQVLGLPLQERAGGVALLGPVPGPPLVELHELAGATPVPRRGRLGLYHYAILLPDRAALGRLVQHLTALQVRPGMSDHLVSEAIYLNDPDGLGIEVYVDRPRESWRYQDGQLVMDTRPLDVDDLVRALGPGEWQGVPTGSVIGHMHLHVGDLGLADRFYRLGLGLDRTVWSYPGALFLSAGGYHHHLGVNTWAAGAVPPGPTDARLLEWEVIVPTVSDAHAALASLALGGAAVTRVVNGGTARDPWGTAVRVLGGSPANPG
jgi:catechol 2,3-dioxygenase